MRRMLYTIAVVSLVAGAGCHRDKYNLSAKFEEDDVLHPDEARFNNPPESGYKKSSKKRESDVRDAPGGLSGGAGRNGAGFNSNGVPGG